MFHFPFGQPLKRVTQLDKTPYKKVFVLGVYASAVHARWIDAKGKELIKALAVSSEPTIFWRGDKVEEFLSCIKMPKELGKLVPPSDKTLNGPSGRALDEKFLEPLGIFNREGAWLCDLLPESRVNPQQRKAIGKHYTTEIIEKYGLAQPSIPDFREDELKDTSPTRHLEILAELKESQAKTLILLGDLPIKWFLNYFTKEYTSLAQAFKKYGKYGKPHEAKIDGKSYNIIPLCHPRNAARLGAFSPTWAELHDEWKPDIL